MKTLYIDCGMGCAGDMLTGALLELHPDPEAFIAKMNTVFGGRAVISAKPDRKCGIKGTHITVLINGDEEGKPITHHHEHTSISEILQFIEGTRQSTSRSTARRGARKRHSRLPAHRRC